MKDTPKTDIEELKIEKINKFNKLTKIKTVIKEIRIEININELANSLDIILIKGIKKFFLKTVEYITNRKNLKIKPVDSSLKKQTYSLLHWIIL